MTRNVNEKEYMSSGEILNFLETAVNWATWQSPGGSLMIFNDVVGGLLAGGVGGIASGFLGITSRGILVPLLVLLLGKDQHVAQGISLVA
jgi:hypothetical protein